MPSLEDLPRIDTRSQWLSTTLADLDRQQDPMSAPPSAMTLETPKISDPLGASENGHAAPERAEPGHAEISTPIQADSVLPPVAMAITAPVSPELTLVQPAAPLPAAPQPAAAQTFQGHVGSTAHDTVSVPTPEAAPTPEPASVGQSVAAQAPLAETAASLLEHVAATSPLLSDDYEVDLPFTDMLGGFGDLFASDDDDGLESSLLEQAGAQLSDMAASLFGDAHDEASADCVLPELTEMVDMADLFEPVTASVQTLVASMTADHSPLASLLNHDLDPHHLLG